MFNPDNALNKILRSRPALALACLTALLIVSCGSGDDYYAGGGIGGTGVTIGTVSDHGSIVVNDVRFDTGLARIYIEGDDAGTGDQAAARLPIGQEVVVQGDITSPAAGTALRIDAFSRVLGPIQSVDIIDEHRRTLTVLGQTVYVDAQTILGGLEITDLVENLEVAVSGPVDDRGALHAGHIALPGAWPTQPMVKGQVRNLNTQAKRFWINDLEVNYASAQTTPLVEGLPVTVRGQLQEEILMAETVEHFVAESFVAAPDFYLEGFVRAAGTPESLEMLEYRLQFDAATVFEGIDQNDIESGARLRVRGRLQNRVLVVDTVRAAARIQLVSVVQTIDPTGGELTLYGMSPLVVRVNDQTRILPGGKSLDDIEENESVRVHALVDNHETVSALMVLGLSAGPQDRFQLEGPVTAIDTFGFEILSVPVDTVSDSIRYYDEDGNEISPEAFLSTLIENETFVRVTGQLAGTLVDYQEMRIIR